MGRKSYLENAKAYRIYLGEDTPPVYKRTKTEVEAWLSRNPGEMQRIDSIHDLIAEMQELADALHEHGIQPGLK